MIRRLVMIVFGLACVVLNVLWLVFLIGPNLPQSWPGAVIASALTVIGVAAIYSSFGPPERAHKDPH